MARHQREDAANTGRQAADTELDTVSKFLHCSSSGRVSELVIRAFFLFFHLILRAARSEMFVTSDAFV